MPVRNADAYVLEAVSSILNQTFEDFELIVVDDDSSDRGVKRIRGIADKRVQLVLNHRRLGVAGALNRGLELASGELIARMDADDVAHPDRLQRQVEFMRAEPGVGVLGTACRVINADASQVLGVATYPSNPAVVGFDMYFTCAVAPPSAMIRAAVLRDAGGFATDVPFAETYHLWLRLSPLGQFANLSEPLLSYRAHAEQISTRHRTARERNYDLIRGMGLFDLLGQELPEKTLAGWNRLARELPIEDEETFDAAIELVEQARQSYLRSKHVSGSAAEAVTARTVDRFVYAARLNSDALPDAASRALVRVE